MKKSRGGDKWRYKEEEREREEAERQRYEERENHDKAVIAVASKEISVGAHVSPTF